MKTHIRILALTTLLSGAAFGQGPLTPPAGTPTPNMKTLQEIYSAVIGVKAEARTPISTLPFTISQPGSYYFTENLTVSSGPGIAISASNVSLDLNGFTISSTHPTGDAFAIFINLGLKNISIRNGNITGTTTVAGSVFTPGGFIGGIGSPSSANQSIQVSDIRVSGIAGSGISIDSASYSTVERCFASTCSGVGIQAHTISDSFATDCRLTGIDGTIIVNSRGANIGATSGSFGIAGAMISNCYGSSINGTGISSGGTVSYSRGKRDGGVAISAAITIGCTVSGTGTVSSAQKHLGTP